MEKPEWLIDQTPIKSCASSLSATQHIWKMSGAGGIFTRVEVSYIKAEQVGLSSQDDISLLAPRHGDIDIFQ